MNWNVTAAAAPATQSKRRVVAQTVSLWHGEEIAIFLGKPKDTRVYPFGKNS